VILMLGNEEVQSQLTHFHQIFWPMLTVSWQLRLNHQIVGARLSGVCADVRHRHGPA